MLSRTVHDPRTRRVVVFAAGTLAVATLSSVAPAPGFASAPTSSTSARSVAPAGNAVGAVAANAAARVLAASAPRQRAAIRVTKTAAPRRQLAPFRFGTPAYSQWWARRIMVTRFAWRATTQYMCLVRLWNRESHWNYRSHNRFSGAHGIPQAMPGTKMARAGSDWRTNPLTQIRWGLGYIKGAYGSPCGAWGHWRSHGWY